jgi:hypothetical protein
MRPSVPDVHITDASDAELSAYRAVTGQAVVGLVFGLLSLLAPVDPLLWSFPAAGVFFSAWALRRIRTDPATMGRKMAVAGLVLSLLFGTAAPTEWLVYRWKIRSEARLFVDPWFRFLTQDEPHKAHQLTLLPTLRRPLDSTLSAHYRNHEKARGELEGYVKIPLVRTLLAMGPKARVRFYTTLGQTHEGNDDAVELLYAVTYDEGGQKKSFLVSVQAIRMKDSDHRIDWRILETKAPVPWNK